MVEMSYRLTVLASQTIDISNIIVDRPTTMKYKHIVHHTHSCDGSRGFSRKNNLPKNLLYIINYYYCLLLGNILICSAVICCGKAVCVCSVLGSIVLWPGRGERETDQIFCFLPKYDMGD